MKLIMAVSKEGYVTRTADDDMSWTGATDKQLFRLLTSVGGHIACGSRTRMPLSLPGRTLHTLSRKRVVPYNPDGPVYNDLEWFNRCHPDGWLVGGQTIAMEALKQDLVDEAFICMSDRKCFPRPDGELCRLQEWISFENSRFVSQRDIKINDVCMTVWRRSR